ncbi:MAG: hypothetical protein Q4G03_02445 [Planctomycetia bacterium]|nr:hypothetical protein [Planctomycetia bacterium]
MKRQRLFLWRVCALSLFLLVLDVAPLFAANDNQPEATSQAQERPAFQSASLEGSYSQGFLQQRLQRRANADSNNARSSQKPALAAPAPRVSDSAASANEKTAVGSVLWRAPETTTRVNSDSMVGMSVSGVNRLISADSDAAVSNESDEQDPDKDTTELQEEDDSAEDKARALTEGSADSPDAPDAAVQIPDASASDTSEPQQTAKPVSAPDSIQSSYGYREAERAVRDMSNDIIENLKAHGGAALYDRWRAYNASIRRRTEGLQTGNELNSRCRLKWYEHIYQDPLATVGEVERMSRAWGQLFLGNSEEVVEGVRLARRLMDVNVRQNRREHVAANTPEEALDMVKAALVEAASKHAKAIAPMSQKDLDAVMNEAYAIFCGQVQSGHTVPSRGRAQYLVDALEKMNKSELYDAGETILSLLDPQTLDALGKVDFESLKKVTLSNDQQVGIINTEAGDILIGGRGRNVWDLDKYPKACCIIDLGGDDVYNEGACVLNRPLLVVIDLGDGNDEYVGKNVAIQGSAILGVSVWYDAGGNDTYMAKDVCQGSCIGGFAALINEKGDDKYLGFMRCQGTALCGFGMLLDRGGKDDYRAAMIAQGVGSPGGFGAIVDRDGNDHYYVGGYYFDSYPEHPGYDGWGQGVGAGIRRVACGGIGTLIDGGGDDAYEFDYFGHGGGYWMGIGVARDFRGNDTRYAATSTMYDGTARRERRWQRFGNGFGCHYACGYLFDDDGDDVYGGTIMGTGMGWDLGAGFLVDFQGNDSFEATGGLTQGAGGEGSIGVLMNYRGNDSYYGNAQGYSSGSLTYHAQSNCGANFSFVVDHGGTDQYGGYDNYRRPIQNNAITIRGTSTGMVIDRPAPDEDKNATNAQSQQNGQQQQAFAYQQPKTTANGMPAKVGQIKTFVAAPPLYDTNPHPTSNGVNAFNPSASDTGGSSSGFGGGRGFGLFGGGRFF